MKRVKLFTLGCKVNQYDTQAIRERFVKQGFKEINNGRVADFCLINTCTVTAAADAKSRGAIRASIRNNPQAKIIVTGCLIENNVDSVADIRGIDFIIPKSFFREGLKSFSGHTRAFLKIQDGCDNFCSYCKVPLARGSSRSRKISEIVKEAKALVKNGFKEIVLCGICLGSYGKDLRPRLSLVDAIERLEKIKGLFRIRLSSIEAGDVTDALIRRMAKSKKLCPHLHIPIQSGDNQILKRMKRSYTHDDYLKLIRKIKRRVPKIAITTDCLVGFPREAEENFQNTLKLVQEIGPLRVHIFPYSSREGTQAADFTQMPGPQIIKKRVKCLQEVAARCSIKYMGKFLNKKMTVLIEHRSREKSAFWEGHTDNYMKVLLESPQNLKNRFICVRLKSIFKDCIFADSVIK